MGFPAGATTITVTGTLPSPVGGAARRGRIVFTPSARLVDSTQKVIYSGGGPAVLDADGKFSVTLLCTDDTDVQPTGWRWRVDEQPSGGIRDSYWIDLPASLGPTVDLSVLAKVSAPDGSGGTTPTARPSGPAGGALAGTYPNPTLAPATIAAFDPAGAASSAQTAAATDATTKANAAQNAATSAAATDATAKVAAHTGGTSDVHGIPDTSLLETQAGAQSKASAAQAAAISAAATDATGKVTAHAGASDPHGDRAAAASDATAKVGAHTAGTDPHGDRAWASSQFATITVVNTLTGTVTTLQGTVTAIDGFLNDCLNRVAAIEQGTAYLAGGHFTGPVDIGDVLTVTGYTTLASGQFNGDVAAFGDLQLIGTGKRYRLRRSGSNLDFEGGGVDLILSVWSDDDFTETQHSYLRFSADAQNVQLAGPLESVTALYGGAIHKLDPNTGVASLGAKNGLANLRLCGRTVTAGAPTTGAWTGGDAVQDSAGAWWLCTASGSPGTWVGGAGGGTSIRSATARIVDGAVVDLPSAASWVIAETSVGTKLECSIPAAAGDRIRVEADFMRSGAHFLDWVLLDNTGAIAVYGTTRSSSPPSEGAPSMYPSTSFPGTQGAKQFVVSGSHIASGQATIALAHQGTAAGRVYANSTYPFEMLLTNLGPEPS